MPIVVTRKQVALAKTILTGDTEAIVNQIVDYFVSHWQDLEVREMVADLIYDNNTINDYLMNYVFEDNNNDFWDDYAQTKHGVYEAVKTISPRYHAKDEYVYLNTDTGLIESCDYEERTYRLYTNLPEIVGSCVDTLMENFLVENIDTGLDQTGKYSLNDLGTLLVVFADSQATKKKKLA